MSDVLNLRNVDFKSWVEMGGLANHLLDLFKIEKVGYKPLAPIKFIPLWLHQEEYIKLVKDAWFPLHDSRMSSFKQ